MSTETYVLNIEVGQIFSLCQITELVYPNPLVIIVENIDGFTVNVAQISECLWLIGPGDVRIPKFGFVETWNSYFLSVNDLEICYGQIDGKLLWEILEKIDREEFIEINSDTYLYNFRLFEMEVGDCLSMMNNL